MAHSASPTGLETDLVPDERPGDAQIAALPLDLAAAAHLAFLPVVGITAWFGQPFRVIAHGWLVKLSRWALTQCLVRTFLVIFAAKLIKSLLLLTQVGSRWLRGGGLECAVHPFVPSILFAAGRARFAPSPDRVAPTRPTNGLRPPRAVLAKGGPLSVRIVRGRPYSPERGDEERFAPW